MRLGRLTVPGYVVDLDDADMVSEGIDCLAEDICNAVKYDTLGTYIKTVEAPDASENDIPDFLTEKMDED